jgi:hypothetical protein
MPRAPSLRHFELLTIHDLKNIPEPPWLIEGVLRQGGFGQLYGGAGSYKTFVTLDWALSVAAGVEWRPGVKTEQGNVVYIIGEGLKKFWRRVEAWLEHRGLPESAIEGHIRFIPEAVQLLDPSHVGGLIADIDAAFDDPPKLIIVDTLSRSLTGADEDKAETMTVVIAAVQQIHIATQASTLLLHHTPYSEERGRGSSSLPGALDVIMGIRKQNKTALSAELYCTKQKDDEEFEPLGINLVKCKESLVATFGDRKKLTASEVSGVLKVSLDVLIPAGERGLGHNDWKNAAAKAGVPAGSFARARKVLIDNDLVTQVGPVYIAQTSGKIIKFTRQPDRYHGITL